MPRGLAFGPRCELAAARLAAVRPPAALARIPVKAPLGAARVLARVLDRGLPNENRGPARPGLSRADASGAPLFFVLLRVFAVALITTTVREQHRRSPRKGAAKRANASGGEAGFELAADGIQLCIFAN